MSNRRLFALELLGASALIAAPASAQRIDRIVAFGDSYADDGNLFQILGPLAPPEAALLYPTGRFSGGTNYVDTLGQLLDAPTANFAIGGALTDNSNSNGPGLPGFITEWNAFLGGGGSVFPSVSGTFDEGDLLTISIGANDARYFQRNGGTLDQAPAAATASAAFATAGLDALVAAGARNISFLAGDTGRLPEIALDPAGAQIRSTYSTTFNQAMQPALAGYAADGVIVHYLDLNAVLDNVIADPAAFGITNGLVCPIFPDPTCLLNASGYLFYGDALHLTSDGFAVVGRYVAAQLQAPLTLQATSDMSLDVARQFGRTLSSRMDMAAPRDGDMPEGTRLFLAGDSYTRRLDAGPTNEAYRSSGIGLTGGIEFGFGSGLVGAAINYSRPRANFGNDAADTRSRSLQLGGYGVLGLAGGFIQAYAGYGWNRHDIDRAGVVEPMDADPDGNHLIAGAKAGYLMPMGIVRIGPVIGLDYARAKVDGYTETGDPALTLHVDSLAYRSLRGSAGIELRSDFGGGGVQLRPYAAAMVEKDFTGDGRTIRFAQVSAPTIVNSFVIEDASKKAYGRVSGGFSAALFPTVTLDVGGSATIGKDQGEETSAQLGVRLAL